MELFKIGENDYTSNIVVPSYKVNKANEVSEWVDVTKTKHQDVERTKVAGDFNMLFETLEELDAFLDDVDNNITTGNYIHAYAYDNRSRQLVESDYFISFELTNDRPFYRVKAHDPINVKIEER